MNTIKDSLLLMDHYPGTEIKVFYIDIRAFGKGFEDLYRRSKLAGVQYIRGLPGELFEDTDTKNIYLAGAFGTFTNLESATGMGIFPEFPNGEYHPLGNGSLSGAYATLLSTEKRKEAAEIAKKMVYVDLLVDLEFIEEYSKALYIPGDKEYFPTLGKA